MQTFFPEVKRPIPFEGPETREPLAFRYYEADRVVAGKTMAEHLRFAVAYWHTFKGGGADMFGGGTCQRPWDRAADPLKRAEATLQAAFEFATKLGVPFYCFHDRDIAPEGRSFAETCRNLDRIVKQAAKLQRDTGLRLLWGTANLFSHPRYANGAATNADPHVFAYAAAQVRHALEATLALGGQNYVFWGGREGYETLLNTDLRQEQEQLARFLHLAVAHARKIGFKGQFLIEPKPKEPTKHQYDFDAATVLGFLRAHDLWDAFKLNIEANHATLAGHTFEHDLEVASQCGKLGSIDANVGDPLLGWDTDQFATDVGLATRAMRIVLQQGGLGSGGLNFDAKVRRASTDTVDLFHGHIGSMDAFARGLLIADRMRQDGVLDGLKAARYAEWQDGFGARMLKGRESLVSIEKWLRAHGEPKARSGRQELFENTFNRYL